MKNEKVESFIENVNGTCEIYKVHYDGFLRAGFSEEQALDLTKHSINMASMQATITMGASRIFADLFDDDEADDDD